MTILAFLFHKRRARRLRYLSYRDLMREHVVCYFGCLFFDLFAITILQ